MKKGKRSSRKIQRRSSAASSSASSSASASANPWLNAFTNCTENLRCVNESKIFAGIMIIILNVSTKFVPMKMSKSMEAFLRHTFSRNVLVFAICWVGTRDVIVSLCITLIFIMLIDFLFNEESQYCILPESFVDYHTSLADTASAASTSTASTSAASAASASTASASAPAVHAP